MAISADEVFEKILTPEQRAMADERGEAACRQAQRGDEQARMPHARNRPASCASA